MTYNFVGMGTSGGQSVSANVGFQVDDGQVVLTLANTTPHTVSAAQLLTGVKFTLLDPATGAITTSNFAAATAIPRTVFDDGTYADGASRSILSSWEKKLTGSTYQLDFNPDAKYAIVGPADGELGPVAGIYSGTNGSLNLNPARNPFVAKSATFTLTDSLIGNGTQITNVSFIYNTGLVFGIPGAPVLQASDASAVPEVSAAWVFGLGLGGACLLRARRKRAGA